MQRSNRLNKCTGLFLAALVCGAAAPEIPPPWTEAQLHVAAMNMHRMVADLDARDRAETERRQALEIAEGERRGVVCEAANRAWFRQWVATQAGRPVTEPPRVACRRP